MRSIPSKLAQSALDTAPDAMLIIDSAGIVQFANRQVSVLFGYAHDDVIGQPIEKLMPARFHSRHIGHRHRYMASAHLRPMGLGLDLYAQRRDGTEFPVEISLSPLEEEGSNLVCAAIRDVSAGKRAESELIEARKLAERANQAKSRFLATASHDLRQPLQALALLNRTLSSVVNEPDARDALSQQEQTIASMSRLLNALLDISKLESGAVQTKQSDFVVSKLFEELRREFSSIADDKGLELEVEEGGESVYSDPSLVEEVLRNLVSNAIKYTRRGSVRLQCRRDAALVRIEVHDTGIGIPADQIPYIFDEFYQVGVSASSSRQGYGLGLSIVHRIAALLGLDLAVRSEPGHGSTFSFALTPSKQAAANVQIKHQIPLARDNAIHRARILLVEDDAGVRNAARLLLTVEGYSVTAVSSLAEAQEAAIGTEKIDLLITDYHLGNGETGLAVIVALRKTLGQTLKTLLITGDTSSVIRKLPQDPNLRIISKPVNADEMLGLLEVLLAT